VASVFSVPRGCAYITESGFGPEPVTTAEGSVFALVRTGPVSALKHNWRHTTNECECRSDHLIAPPHAQHTERQMFTLPH